MVVVVVCVCVNGRLGCECSWTRSDGDTFARRECVWVCECVGVCGRGREREGEREREKGG